MTLSYEINGTLYINITNRCTNRCVFCQLTDDNFVFDGFDLRHRKKPKISEFIEDILNRRKYKEYVFCGLGEPLIRIRAVKKIAEAIREKFPGSLIRVNTNGHANIIHGRDVLPELKGIIDRFSVSLNADNSEDYYKICQPVISFSGDIYEEVCGFIRAAKKDFDVQATYVDVNTIDDEKIIKQFGIKPKKRKVRL